MVLRKPVGRSEAVGDLLAREGERAPRHLLGRRVGSGRRRRRAGRPRRWYRIRPCRRIAGRANQAVGNEKCGGENERDGYLAHLWPPRNGRTAPSLRRFTP